MDLRIDRDCPCGAQLSVDASGSGVAGATPTGWVMSASDLQYAAQSAQRSAHRNARRNAFWARCPRCGSRARGAWVFAALSQFIVVFPAAILGAILGCTVGLIRQTIDPNTMAPVAIQWASVVSVAVLSVASWRRLREADRSTQLEVRRAEPSA